MFPGCGVSCHIHQAWRPAQYLACTPGFLPGLELCSHLNLLGRSTDILPTVPSRTGLYLFISRKCPVSSTDHTHTHTPLLLQNPQDAVMHWLHRPSLHWEHFITQSASCALIRTERRGAKTAATPFGRLLTARPDCSCFTSSTNLPWESPALQTYWRLSILYRQETFQQTWPRVRAATDTAIYKSGFCEFLTTCEKIRKKVTHLPFVNIPVQDTNSKSILFYEFLIQLFTKI